MANAADIDTQKKIKKVEKEIETIYSEAQVELEAKIKDFTSKYKVKEAIHQKELDDGKITQAQFDSWKRGQVFQGDMWKAKRDQMINTVHNANSIAAKIVNGASLNVFANNANYQAYDLEHGAGVNFGFLVYDNASVVKLIKDNPDLLPKWKVDEPKDYTWNKKKVSNAITQGIIQGKKLDEISQDLAEKLATQNENRMKTFAKTAMTGAQNAGREETLMRAAAKGVNIMKQWMATLDGRTRDSHADLDGEKVKVAKDIWHPTKFSNGCRYPGDPQGPPHEVYNCRCKLVGDLVDYPEEYQRYDNIDGKPIKNMTYKEWYKAKYAKEFKVKKAVEKVASTVLGIDYAKYGGKEAFDIIVKYDGDIDKIISEAPVDEFDVLWNKYGSITGIEEMANKAKADIGLSKKLEKQQTVKKVTKAKGATEAEKLQNQVDTLKADLKKFEDNLDMAVLNKKYSGIWQEDVTLFDYGAKKDKIVEKQLYYFKDNQKIARSFVQDELNLDPDKYEDLFFDLRKYDSFDDLKKDKTFINELLNITDKDGFPLLHEDYDINDDLKDLWDVFKDSMHAKRFKQNMVYLDKLQEFETLGKQYSDVLKELEEKRLQVKAAEKALKAATQGNPFETAAYTAIRKDNAFWASSSRQYDDHCRAQTGEFWRAATEEQKNGIYEYTQSYHKFNEPLRGIQYGSEQYLGVGNTDLNAVGNGKFLNAMTELIDHCSYDEDIWLQRGCHYKGMDKFFNCSMDLLQNGTQEELEAALLGTTPTEYAFMSCGSTKGKGLNLGEIVLNVYAPSGTKMMYVEPFSAFGDGSRRRWDGYTQQTTFGRELETILQQGTQFRVTKVEKAGNGTLYFDLEVIAQNEVQVWKP